MNKIIIVLFQGGGTNQKYWNEHTCSNFLNKLKEIGSVYTYQDKSMNIYHYCQCVHNYGNYNSDIDFNFILCKTK